MSAAADDGAPAGVAAPAVAPVRLTWRQRSQRLGARLLDVVGDVPPAGDAGPWGMARLAGVRLADPTSEAAAVYWAWVGRDAARRLRGRP